MTIPRFAKNPRLIEEYLSIGRKELMDYLEQLLKLKIISRQDEKWIINQSTIHLSRESELYPVYRVLLRTKALEKLQRGDRPKDYGFSVLISSDELTRKLIQQKFMEFLKTIEAAVKKSDPTEVYQINFDLLSWSDL